MSRRGQIIVALFFLVVIGSGTAWFYENFEQVEEEIEVERSEELLRNQFLVLETFLEKMDLEVENGVLFEEFNLRERDLASTVAFVYAENLGVSRSAREELLELLDQGLHLVLVHPREETVLEGMLLDELEVERDVLCDLFSSEAREEWEEEEEEFSGEAESRKLIGDMIGEDGIVRYELSYSSGYCWMMAPRGVDFVGYDEGKNGVAAASAPRGAGRLTVMMEWQWLSNDHLNQGNQGQLLADVLSLQGEWPEEAWVALMRGGDRGWFWTVYQRGWPVFLALMVFLMLGFSRARRFGPEIPEPLRERRRRAEHVAATGRFLWHHHSSDVLLKASRRALLEAVARRRPSIRTMKEREQTRVMAEELGISKEEMWRLLKAVDSVSRNEDFRKLISRLEELRRRL